MVWAWLSSGPPKRIVLCSAFCSVGGALYLLRDKFEGVRFNKKIICKGKVVIITGGNSGIGKETAKELARRGAVVYLVCRDKTRCDKARKEIALDTRNRYVFSRVCDLGSLSSVREFAEQFKKEQKRLDILINNAGVFGVPYRKTEDGFETHLGVNHLGHFLLTNLLLDILIKSAPSRIINVSSVAHVRGKINKEDLNSEKKYENTDAYNQSKLANILFTKALAERLQGTGVTANAVNPGVVNTTFYQKNSSSLSLSFVNTITKPLRWVFFKSPFAGAQTTLYAALDPELKDVTGKYFANCKAEEVAPHADDEVTAKWLWLVSEKWTKLAEDGKVTLKPTTLS